MSTARTTPAQNPRGPIRSNTFPLLTVSIVTLIDSFRSLYHTLRPRHPARVSCGNGCVGTSATWQARNLPVGVLGSVEGCGLEPGVYVEDIVAAPAGRVWIILDCGGWPRRFDGFFPFRKIDPRAQTKRSERLAATRRVPHPRFVRVGLGFSFLGPCALSLRHKTASMAINPGSSLMYASFSFTFPRLYTLKS